MLTATNKVPTKFHHKNTGGVGVWGWFEQPFFQVPPEVPPIKIVAIFLVLFIFASFLLQAIVITGFAQPKKLLFYF